MQHDFILLDRSGSMSNMWVEAVNSVNSYVEKISQIDTGVTLAVFDMDIDKPTFDIVRDRIIPSTWNKVFPEEVRPRGMTPLNDSIAKIVNLANAGNYDKVAIIIITDGYENASKEYSQRQAKELLQKCRDKGWQVIFLGANFDNTTQAQAYGNAANATVMSSVGNMRATMSAMSEGRSSYSRGIGNMEFTDEQKEELKKANPS